MSASYLQLVLSLKFPSSSSEPCRLTLRLWDLEFAAEDVRDDVDKRDCAFFETVLWLSKACLLKSCISAAAVFTALGGTKKVVFECG